MDIRARSYLYDVVHLHLLLQTISNFFVFLHSISARVSIWPIIVAIVHKSITNMAARRSLARGIPALRTVSPRTGFTTKSVAAGTWRTSKSASPLSQSVVSQNSRRYIHITAHRSSQQYGTQSAASTTTEFPTSHEPITSPIDTTNFIDNEFVTSKASEWIDLHDPATNNLVTRVPQSTDDELKAAVASAEKAFPAWRATSIIARQEIMFKFVSLIRRDWDRLAASITLEQGKTFADAKGDVLRGLQVAETACGIPSQITGDILEVAKDMETRSYREPLGVVAAICPFSEYTQSKSCHGSQANMYRLPCYDSPLVYPRCHRHGEHHRHQTI